MSKLDDIMEGIDIDMYDEGPEYGTDCYISGESVYQATQNIKTLMLETYQQALKESDTLEEFGQKFIEKVSEL